MLSAGDMTQPVAASHFRRATGMNLKLRFLVALTSLSLAPAFLLVLLYQHRLLQGRNVPLIFLIIVVVTSLVATWVALPMVQPIRRATREILASTEDVRLLALQAGQIVKDHRLGTDMLQGASKGLDLRRRAIGRDAGLIANSSTTAAARLAQLAHLISELPESSRTPMQVLTRGLYQDLHTAHLLAAGISSSLERDPVQKRLGNVMEGAAEISEQFDEASKQLENGATRLKHAAESLQ